MVLKLIDCERLETQRCTSLCISLLIGAMQFYFEYFKKLKNFLLFKYSIFVSLA